jgi:sec-independent protein translocase protein TatA
MVGNLSGMHLLAILAIVLLLFGAPRLPGLARSLGQSMRILKQEAGDDSSKQPSEPTGGSPEV